MNRFQDKVVVITGASRGIGRACALRMAREGATVVVNYKRNATAAEHVVEQVKQAGGDAVAIAADVAEPEAVGQMLQIVESTLGRLDAIVVNAAASAFKDLLDIKPHHLDKTFALSLGGFLSLVQGGVGLMPGGGRVVVTSGWDSFRVMPGHGVLGAAKAAMEAAVRQFAVELGPRGVLVTGVSPGPVVTDSARFYAGDEWDKLEQAWLPLSPLGRFAQPEDIAEIVTFLASPDNTWITGQTIVADGGLSLATLPL